MVISGDYTPVKCWLFQQILTIFQKNKTYEIQQ